MFYLLLLTIIIMSYLCRWRGGCQKTIETPRELSFILFWIWGPAKCCAHPRLTPHKVVPANNCSRVARWTNSSAPLHTTHFHKTNHSNLSNSSYLPHMTQPWNHIFRIHIIFSSFSLLSLLTWVPPTCHLVKWRWSKSLIKEERVIS